MRVSSVQSNINSQSFNGRVYVRNLVARKTRTYTVTPEADRALAESYSKIHSSLNLDSSIALIKRYVSELYETTKDDFFKKLPIPIKEESQGVELSSRSAFATYKGGDTYFELKTDGFEITHDMAK